MELSSEGLFIQLKKISCCTTIQQWARDCAANKWPDARPALSHVRPVRPDVRTQNKLEETGGETGRNRKKQEETGRKGKKRIETGRHGKK